jgi:maltooligosyltrehalose trehalohydrolase
MNANPKLGASHLGDSRCQFCVWAPSANSVKVHLLSPEDKLLPLASNERGYFSGIFEGVAPGSLYVYNLEGQGEYPDPASRFQPHGVHGPSQVLDEQFEWGDVEWQGIPITEYLVYELHTGTFTPQGTFDAVTDHLDRLKHLGITAVEIMPVAQFPGSRNWGYDGVYPFAVQDTYGGPTGLKKLVNACHRSGLAVILDVVYNHFGPEGNYLAKFGPYFTERYRTPWGAAMNLDGPDSDEVRRLFIENALYWVNEFHMDALRVDALHGIVDQSAQPFLQELAQRVHEAAGQLKRQIFVLGESDLNDTRVLRSPLDGGFGFDAQCNDDFHHSVHALLTGEQNGYYGDFGEMAQLAKAWNEGFVYSGEYSKYRRRRHGNSSRDIPGRSFVVATQNHDQVGNRMLGERLSQLVSFDSLKLAAGLVLLSPFIPLLFMGEEWGETAPFLYFISHSDPDLIEAVRRGRREEFAGFAWQGESPDPQDETTFSRCQINHDLREEGHHRTLYNFYRELIRLRKHVPCLARLDKNASKARCFENSEFLHVQRWGDGTEVTLLFNIGKGTASPRVPLSRGRWHKLLDSADQCWDGPGTRIPEEIVSDGLVPLDMPSRTLIVLERERLG